MKKNILLLINGFGVERADSYSVYSKELMPNMDRLTNERIFMTIPNNYYDYKSAYRELSMGIKNPLTYSLVDGHLNNLDYKENKLLKYMCSELVKHKSRLHIICYWDSDRTIEQLIPFVKEFQSQSNAKIFLHLVLCQKSVNEYKEIDRWFSNLAYEMGNNVKLGVITGENNFKDTLALKEIVKCFMTEFGEKWRDLKKKVEVLVQNKTNPGDVRTFSVNADYKLQDNDLIFLFNYSNVDISNFKKELPLQKFRSINYDSLQYYSLFPAKSDKQIPFMYNFAVSSDNLQNTLKTVGVKCLVLDKKEKCPYINYFLCGLRNETFDELKFLPTDDGNVYDPVTMLEILKIYEKDIFIINYDLDNCKTLEEILDRLKKIDVVIGEIDKFARENNWGFFISSLYGIEKQMYNKKQEICKINFSGKVPVIISDNDINLTNYSTEEGGLFDLGNTVISNTNFEYKNTGLLKKKSALLSFLYKKPKASKVVEEKQQQNTGEEQK